MKCFRLNATQVIFSAIGGLIIVPLLMGMFHNPSVVGFVFLALIAYWTVGLFYVTATPIDDKILHTPGTQEAILKNTCPFCGTEPISSYTLKVGYKRGQYSDFKYMLIWIQWRHSRREIYARLGICESCRRKYLKACSRKILPKGMRNPSKIVLRRKLGYRRGIVFPFESWNLKSSLDE